MNYEINYLCECDINKLMFFFQVFFNKGDEVDVFYLLEKRYYRVKILGKRKRLEGQEKMIFIFIVKICLILIKEF